MNQSENNLNNSSSHRPKKKLPPKFPQMKGGDSLRDSGWEDDISAPHAGISKENAWRIFAAGETFTDIPLDKLDTALSAIRLEESSDEATVPRIVDSTRGKSTEIIIKPPSADDVKRILRERGLGEHIIEEAGDGSNEFTLPGQLP